MSRKTETSLVFFNLLTLFVIGSVSYALDRSVDVINHPLVFTEVVSCCLLVWNVVGFSMFPLAGDSLSLGKKKTKAHLWKSGTTYAGAVILFSLLAVLYGAPLSEKLPETFHLALLLASTTVIPTVCIIGSSAEDWVRVILQNGAESYAERCCQVLVSCSILGAWVGAVPIPLDWDRPWQEWPISCIIGTLGGYGAGLFLSSTAFRWHYVHSMKSKLG